MTFPTVPSHKDLCWKPVIGKYHRNLLSGDVEGGASFLTSSLTTLFSSSIFVENDLRFWHYGESGRMPRFTIPKLNQRACVKGTPAIFEYVHHMVTFFFSFVGRIIRTVTANLAVQRKAVHTNVSEASVNCSILFLFRSFRSSSTLLYVKEGIWDSNTLVQLGKGESNRSNVIFSLFSNNMNSKILTSTGMYDC